MSFAVVTRVYIALCFILVALILETRACWRAAVDPSAAPQFSMYDPQHKNCTLEEWETHLRRAGIGAEFANLWARGRTVEELRQTLGKPQDWKAEQIIAFAQRRTTDEILQKFGPPERISDPPRSGGVLSYVADKAWSYDTGYSTTVILYIREQRCFAGEAWDIFH